MKRFKTNILCVLIFCAWITVCSLHLQAASILDIRWDSKTDFTRCVIELSESVPIKDWDLSHNGLIYVDFYQIDKKMDNRNISIESDSLKSMHVISYPEENVLRVVYNLKNEVRYSIQMLTGPHRVVFDLYPKFRQTLQNAFLQNPGANKSTAKKLIIIDPGHGGRDPGALSRDKINGRYIQEKDMTLRVAKKLQALINKSPTLECVLTRNTDRYVSLDDRVRFAEKHKGDLFISIHYNAVNGAQKARQARGVEFYYLNPSGSQREAVRLLEEIENRERATGTKKITGNAKSEALFKQIVTNKLNKQIMMSNRFCKYLDFEFSRDPYFKRYNRGIKDARFRVLNRQYSRPTVLIEVGFLTNRNELQELITERNQNASAICIFNAINRYFKEKDPKFVAYSYK